MASNRPVNQERSLYASLTGIAVLAVTGLSFMPAADKSALHTRGEFHSIAHLLIFAVVAYVAGRISRHLPTRIVIYAATLAFGFGIELGEHLMYQTIIEWPDILLDALGVVTGSLLAFYTAPTTRS